ncbi:MAG: cupin domain-containing protein [Myxococcales bacterium]|nr:cupin domain-containing protein [Myxococcales bacterium]
MHRLSALPHEQLRSARTGEAYALSAVLPTGALPLFAHHDVVPPGRRASATHAHSHATELVLVLSGVVVVVDGDREVPLASGEFVVVSPGRPHHVENRGPEEARLLVLASRQPEDVVTYAP